MPASLEPCPEFRRESVVLQALTEGADVVGSDVEVVSHAEIQPRIDKRHIPVQRRCGDRERRAARPPQCRNSARQTPAIEQFRDCTSTEEDQLSLAGKSNKRKEKWWARRLPNSFDTIDLFGFKHRGTPKDTPDLMNPFWSNVYYHGLGISPLIRP